MKHNEYLVGHVQSYMLKEDFTITSGIPIVRIRLLLKENGVVDANTLYHELDMLLKMYFTTKSGSAGLQKGKPAISITVQGATIEEIYEVLPLRGIEILEEW